MSTIAKFLAQPPDNFSTQISSSTVATDDLSVTLDSTSGLPTEGVGQFFKKDAQGNLVSGSVEFVHWTNVSGNTMTFSDVNDRGISGSDSGAQAYVADDYFEVWASTYYVGGVGGLIEHNADGTHVDASAAEVKTGTEAGKMLTPKNIRDAGIHTTKVVGIQVVDSGVDVTTGDGKAFFRVPLELNGMNLTGVAATVYTAGTTGSLDITIYNKTQAADMLSTAMRIETGETDTLTSAQPGVIDTGADDVVTGDVIVINIDSVQTTEPQGLYVETKWQLP